MSLGIGSAEMVRAAAAHDEMATETALDVEHLHGVITASGAEIAPELKPNRIAFKTVVPGQARQARSEGRPFVLPGRRAVIDPDAAADVDLRDLQTVGLAPSPRLMKTGVQKVQVGHGVQLMGKQVEMKPEQVDFRMRFKPGQASRQLRGLDAEL